MYPEQMERIYTTMRGALLAACAEASATPYEAMLVAMQLFSDRLAVYMVDAAPPRTALRQVIEQYCGNAATLAYDSLEDDTESGTLDHGV